MNNTADMVKNLERILAEEDAAHDELMENAQKLNNAVKKADLDAIVRITGIYDSRIAGMENLEEYRLAVCDELSEVLSGEKRHLNLSTLTGMLPTEQRSGLTSLQKALKEKVRALNRVNTSNRILLEAALGAVETGVEIKIKAQKHIEGYCRNGTKTSKPVTKNLVKFTA